MKPYITKFVNLFKFQYDNTLRKNKKQGNRPIVNI